MEPFFDWLGQKRSDNSCELLICVFFLEFRTSLIYPSILLLFLNDLLQVTGVFIKDIVELIVSLLNAAAEFRVHIGCYQSAHQERNP